MKKTFNILLICAANFAFAQIAIGKSSISLLPTPPNPANTINPFISLEFGDYVAGQGRGIVLPWVDSAADVAGSVNGTIFLDVNDKIVKYQNGTGTYFSLSKNETTQVGSSNTFNTLGVVSTTLQSNLTDLPTAKVSIGTPVIPNVPGVLVLESTTQAMVLPKVASPQNNIFSPEPGTIVYDTDSRQLAVYNGTVWSFWKP